MPLSIRSPNPEKLEAMKLVIELAQKHSTDLACAHDPDGDRFAVAIKKDGGEKIQRCN